MSIIGQGFQLLIRLIIHLYSILNALPCRVLPSPALSHGCISSFLFSFKLFVFILAIADTRLPEVFYFFLGNLDLESLADQNDLFEILLVF